MAIARNEPIKLSLDGLIGSQYDRIIYTYMCQNGLETTYCLLSELYKYRHLVEPCEREEQVGPVRGRPHPNMLRRYNDVYE
jgi:hypothetical protein